MSALSIRDLSFSYTPPVQTIRECSLEVGRGEMLTIVGPNGSGKSTLLKLCSRILTPDNGQISLLGRDLASYRRDRLAQTLAVVPQDGHIEFPFTVLEMVLMGRTPHGQGWAFENREDYRVAREVMELTDITGLADHPFPNLSGGERQRVLIARALAQEPEVILLDEPNAHLDIAHQIEIFVLMKRMNAERRMTVIGVSHDLNLASAYSDRIAMMTGGRIVAVGPPHSVVSSEQIRAVFRADVIVDKHPIRQTPRVTLVGVDGQGEEK